MKIPLLIGGLFATAILTSACDNMLVPVTAPLTLTETVAVDGDGGINEEVPVDWERVNDNVDPSSGLDEETSIAVQSIDVVVKAAPGSEASAIEFRLSYYDMLLTDPVEVRIEPGDSAVIRAIPWALDAPLKLLSSDVHTALTSSDFPTDATVGVKGYTVGGRFVGTVEARVNLVLHTYDCRLTLRYPFGADLSHC